jgi:phosphoserine phosphatase
VLIAAVTAVGTMGRIVLNWFRTAKNRTLQGRWWQIVESSKPHQAARLDRISFHIRRGHLSGSAKRMWPPDARGRRWRIEGYLSNDLAVMTYHTVLPELDAVSFGTYVFQQDLDSARLHVSRWRGFYTLPERDLRVNRLEFIRIRDTKRLGQLTEGRTDLLRNDPRPESMKSAMKRNRFRLFVLDLLRRFNLLSRAAARLQSKIPMETLEDWYPDFAAPLERPVVQPHLDLAASGSSPGRIALLDWDNSLHAGYTFYEWLIFLASRNIVSEKLVEDMKSDIDGFEAGWVEASTLGTRNQAHYAKEVAGLLVEQLLTLSHEFAEIDKTRMFPSAIDLLEWCGKEDILPVVVTGAPQEVVEIHLKRLYQGHRQAVVIGLSLEVVGEQVGSHLHQNGGIGSTKQWVVEEVLDAGARVVIGVGDSFIDSAMLLAAERPIVVGNERLFSFIDKKRRSSVLVQPDLTGIADLLTNLHDGREM